MAAVKKRRVVALVTLVAGDPGKPQDVAPGQGADIEAGEAEALVRRGFATWAKADTPVLPLEGDGTTEPPADA